MNYEKTAGIKINLLKFRFIFIIFIISVDLSAFISARKSSDLEVNTESKVKWKQIILVKRSFDAKRRPLCPPLVDVFDYPKSRTVATEGQKTSLQPPLVLGSTVTSGVSAVDTPEVHKSIITAPGGPVIAPDGTIVVGIEDDSIIKTPEIECQKGQNRDHIGRCTQIW